LKNSINRDRLMRANAILLMHAYYCNFRECGTSASHSASYLCKCSCRGLPATHVMVMRVIEFSVIFICSSTWRMCVCHDLFWRWRYCLPRLIN